MQPWFPKSKSFTALMLLGGAACIAVQPAAAQVVVIDHSDSTDTGTIRMHDADGRGITINFDDHDNSSGIVRFGENIVVEAGEEVRGDVVAIGGSIKSYGEIWGDCVAIGGTVRIMEGGQVRGEVVSIGGTLTLEPNVVINGDAVSIWGRLKKDSTAIVNGDVVQVGGLGPIAWGSGNWGGNYGGLWQVSSLARRIIWVAILLGLGALLFKVFPGQMTYLTETIHTAGVKAFLWGLLFWILWLPVVIALCITVIGIIAALGLIFLTPLIVLLGYLAAAKALGMRFTGSPMNSLRPFLIGLLALEGGLILARIVGVGGALGFLSMILSAIAGTAIFLAITTGVGALMITRFRSKPKPKPAEAPPAPEIDSSPLPPSETTPTP